MSEAPITESELQAYADGRLDAKRRMAVEAWLATRPEEAERIADYPFVPPRVRRAMLERPGWFLYSLLCYDVWHKLFVSRELARESGISWRRRAKPTSKFFRPARARRATACCRCSSP